jgi:hypothetical protein
MEKINFTVITQRIFAPTPQFWQRIRSLAIAVGGSAVAVLTANSTLDLALPVIVITVVKYTIAMCVAIAGTAQLTKEDKP